MAMGRAPQCVVFTFLQSHFTFFGLDLGCYQDLQGVHNADWSPHNIHLAFVITCIVQGKVLNFKVPEFTGETLQGDVFEQKVVSVFGNNAML